jgi:hypothetical protein
MLLATRENEDGTGYNAYSLEHIETTIRILEKDVRLFVQEHEQFPQGFLDKAHEIWEIILEANSDPNAAAEAATENESSSGSDIPHN